MASRILSSLLFFAGTASSLLGQDPPAVRTFHIPQRGTIRVTAANWMPVDGLRPTTVDDVLALRRRLVAREYDKAAFEAKAFLDALGGKERAREIPPPPGGAPAPPGKAASPFGVIDIAFDPGRYSHRQESRQGDLRLIGTPHADALYREVTDEGAAQGLRRQINHYGCDESSYVRYTVGHWFSRTPLMLENDWEIVRASEEGTLYRGSRTEPRPMTFFVLAAPDRDEIRALIWTAGEAETLVHFWLFAGEVPADPDRPFVVPRIALNFDPEWTANDEQFWQMAAAYVDEARLGVEPAADAFVCHLRRGDVYVADSDGKKLAARTIDDVGVGFDIASMTPEDVVKLLQNSAN